MKTTTSCEKKRDEIFKFESSAIWKNHEFKNFLIPEITLVGKYITNNHSKIISYKYEVEVIKNNQKKKETKSIECYMDELEDINGIKISLLTPLNLRPSYVGEKPYQIIGKLITFPDGYSSKIKLYAQLLVCKINNVSKEAEYYSEMNRVIELREKLFELIENPKRNKQDIEWISLRLKEKEKVNFLIIASLEGYNGIKKTDILNDVYGKNYKQDLNKKEMEKYFGFSTESDQNIIRVNFSNKKIVISEINKKIEAAKKNNLLYDYLVFVKGGGQNMSIFNDTEFCDNIINLKIPFITAVGHSDDDCRLLCLLSDIDLITPTELGKTLISEIFNLKKECDNTIKESNGKKEKIFNEFEKKELEKMEENILKLENENNSLNQKIIYLENNYSKNLKEKDDKIKLLQSNLNKTEINLNNKLKENEQIEKNKIVILENKKNEIERKLNKFEKKRNAKDFLLIIAFILILFLTGYVVYSNFFKNTIEIKKDSSAITNTKIEKDKINNLAKPKVKDEKTKKEAIQKKLIYSEDEVFTALLWKGYKGERAIYDFQKANKMKQTGKVDEALLKKLGIKIRYK